MKRHHVKAGSRGRCRGSSFIELLISLAILGFMMVGVLQLFSLSLAVNKASAARTEMLFRCQQVVENIRYYVFLRKNGFAFPVDTGIPWPLPDTLAGPPASPFNLPYLGTEPEYAYWGPAGANVITQPNGPYQLYYQIELTQAGSTWTSPLHIVTVTAVPTNVPGANRYFGLGLGFAGSGKRIDYVAQF